MPHPFQCIASVTPQAAENGSFLLAACGPKLLSLSSKDGSIVSQWTADAAVSELDSQKTLCVVGR
jgi:tRNA (guanine-N(7)-)-methyltransferase subunit TRM82